MIHTGVCGVVDQEPASSSWNSKSGGGGCSPSRSNQDGSQSPRAGRVVYSLNGLPDLEIPLHAGDCDLRSFPRRGDRVRFDINQCKATKETSAVNVVVVERVLKEAPQQQQQQQPEGQGASKEADSRYCTGYLPHD